MRLLIALTVCALMLGCTQATIADVPTPTLIATNTPSPTATATPLPTATPVPTPTPTLVPTSTSEPTPAPEPTAAPGPEPTATPTPTMSPTPTPRPTGLWAVSEEVNPIDDTMTVTAVLLAKEGQGVYGDQVTMALRCKSDRVEAFILWFSYLGSDDPTVTYRFGTEAALTNYWGLSSDSTATFYRGPLNELDADYMPFHDSFVKKLMTVDRFVAQVTPYNENPITAVFDLTGIEHVGQQVLEACS